MEIADFNAAAIDFDMTGPPCHLKGVYSAKKLYSHII